MSRTAATQETPAVFLMSDSEEPSVPSAAPMLFPTSGMMFPTAYLALRMATESALAASVV